MIGDNVKLVYLGGSGNNAHVIIDAPKEVSIVRSRAAEKRGMVQPSPFYRDSGLSEEAQQKTRQILKEEKQISLEKSSGQLQKAVNGNNGG